ncbi:hypothetical protein ACFX1T_033037 [Malus domestica]
MFSTVPFGTQTGRNGTGRDGTEQNEMEVRVMFDYKFLSSAPTWKSGSGSISLPLVNLRFNYFFRIFSWKESEVDPNHLNQDHNPLPGIAHLLATSDDELSFESGRVPDQIHLAYMDGDDEMRVMFVTPDGAGEEEGLLW